MNPNRYHVETAGTVLVAVLFSFALGTKALQAQTWRQAVSLRGSWKFEIGDRPEYRERSYDDSKWEQIRVPEAWENEGFPGYDGFAWYRKSFRTPPEAQEYLLYLRLGSIDDADEAYVNGKLVGYQGGMPPHYQTAYNYPRHYLIPSDFLDPTGENVIAVRVYDDEQIGGIVQGDLGIFYTRDQMEVVLPLNGVWKLKMADDPNFSKIDCDDASWHKVAVPALWDSYGYKDYDGVGWYRTRFRLPENLQDEKLILFLGRIDDVDQVYLNGKLVGKTGRWPERTSADGFYDDYYRRERAYFIPKDMLYTDRENVVAVRVYDVTLHGGIWDGPVGLAEKRQYMRWRDRTSSPEEFLWRLFH